MLTTMEEKGLLGTIAVGDDSINIYPQKITVNCNGNIIPVYNFSGEVVNVIMHLIFAEGYSCVQGVLTKVEEPFEGTLTIELPYPVELPKSKAVLETTEDIDLYIGYHGITDELEEATKGLNAPRGTNWYNTLRMLGKK